MGLQVCTGATLQCSFGTAPSTLAVLPQNKVNSTTPAANVMDNVPVVNVPPFGTCSSTSNPVVAVGAGEHQGDDREDAGAGAELEVDVHVGRGDPDPQPRSDEGERCLTVELPDRA